jgi:hypothetical protein
MRKDIPMLKRAEEGIGESMSGFGTSYNDTFYPNHEDPLNSRPKSPKRELIQLFFWVHTS